VEGREEVFFHNAAVACTYAFSYGTAFDLLVTTSSSDMPVVMGISDAARIRWNR
jgi:hypothetical protein